MRASKRANRRSKIVIVVGVALVSALVVTVAQATRSVTPPAFEGTGKGTVHVWTEYGAGATGKTFGQYLSNFQKRNAGIKMIHRPIPNNTFYVISRTGMAGSNPPDLLQYEGGQQTLTWVKTNKLLDLTWWWNANKSRFVLPQAVYQACRINGKIYCIPQDYIGGNQIYYNTELLSKLGLSVPTTWNDFLAALDKAKSSGIYGIAFGDKDLFPGEHLWMVLLERTCGSQGVLNALNNKAKWTDPCFEQAATDFQMLEQKGYFSPGASSDDYGTAQAIFKSGKALFYQTGSWFAQTPPDFKMGIMRPPGTKTTETVGATVSVWGIPTHGKNPAGALKFLSYVLQKPQAVQWVKAGALSFVSGAVEAGGNAFTRQLWVNQYRTAAVSMPWLELYLPLPIGEEQVYKGLQSLLTGQLTPAAYVKSIQDAVDKAKHK
jgi:ABC-type glycerol-3-phosphate transport system substrate-binding protein